MKSSGAVKTCALSGGQSDGFLQVAHEVADVAAEITKKYFRKSFDVDVKADMSPVTIADREAERAMRQVLASRLPEHSIFGEEEGFTSGSKSIESDDGSSFLWVLDPIDGTKSFITGVLWLPRICPWPCIVSTRMR
jgi:inositol-phosphate phosphatase/L-galactose 1-phosphate phosphatase/histidinol-phosphatase